jgi:hypothetical protein
MRDDFDPSTVTQAMIYEIHALDRESDAAGVTKFACGIFPAANAKTLRKQPDGEVLVSDGRYVEAKEHVDGFWILEAADKRFGPISVSPFVKIVKAEQSGRQNTVEATWAQASPRARSFSLQPRLLSFKSPSRKRLSAVARIDSSFVRGVQPKTRRAFAFEEFLTFPNSGKIVFTAGSRSDAIQISQSGTRRVGTRLAAVPKFSFNNFAMSCIDTHSPATARNRSPFAAGSVIA